GKLVARSVAASVLRFVYLPETLEYTFRSLAAVPLPTAGKVIGAINVQTTAQHDYPPNELELLGVIADLAAGAIEKATLYDNMRRQIMELSTLAEVSQAITSPLYLEEILRLILEMAARMLDAETKLLTTLANQTALAIENANLVVRSAVIREMHHRVKNNLQTIAMLLRLQLRDGREVSGREVLTETINRVLSIAAVHEILSV